MKIGLVTSSYPRFVGDHAGSFVRGFARALAKSGHHVEVLAPEPASSHRDHDTPPHRDHGATVDRDPGIDVVHVPYLRPRSWQRTFYGAGAPENLALDPRAWLGVVPFAITLSRVIAERAPRWDAVVSHWAVPSGLLAARVLGPTTCDAAKPHLVVCHSGDVHAITRIPGGARIARAITERASSLLFVSTELRDRWLSLLGPIDAASAAARCHVSPMGVDREDGSASSSRKESRRSWRMTGTTLVSLGRLVPIKGLGVLLAAIAGRRDVELIIAGEGPERARLERLAARLGCHCRFVGLVAGARKRALLAGADALVLSSLVLPSGRTEGAPTAMIEAMAAGLPVIASSVGGIPSLVGPRRAALLVPPGDPVALARAIDTIRARPDERRRLARAGATLARSLEWDRLAPELCRLVEPVLPRSTGGATNAPLWAPSSYGARRAPAASRPRSAVTPRS